MNVIRHGRTSVLATLAATLLAGAGCAESAPATASTSGSPQTRQPSTKPQDIAMKKATFIRLRATAGKAGDLAALLVQGRELAVRTEPRTINWYALTREKAADEQAIFDTFPDQQGREAHFGGQVAAALKNNAGALVEGGWESGVLSNVTNFDILAAKYPPGPRPSVGRATLILLTAAPGKADDLEKFLIAGREIAVGTEPKTLYWFALKTEGARDKFAIYDLFADEDGRQAHFNGQIAGGLKAASAQLVQGGWEQGVLANVTNFVVNASK